MTQLAVIDERDLSVTPVFKVIQVEDINASERAGHLVMKTREVVEVRIAGYRDVKVFPSDAVWRREGNRAITYAERWPEQYASYHNGDDQMAAGTPLEMLRPYGISESMISVCRALKVYSIEALYSLEDRGLKALGMNGNRLKDAARQFMSERQTTASALSEVEALKQRIAELEASGSKVEVPKELPTDDDVEAALAASDSEFAAMSDAQIKDEIGELAGAKPRGNPSRETLENSLRELREAKAA